MADADTIYRVLTVYDAETRAAEHSVGGLAIVFDHLINLMERAGHLIHTIWELDTAAESAQIAMAGLMNAARFPGADDFNRSMVMSSELMKIMRHDAAALSGTYEQMQSIFQAIIPVAHEAGQSLMGAEKMSGKVMEFGNTFKIPAEFIGREFRQMMEGRASVRNALFKDLSMFMGNISGQDFNALASPEKWEKVNEALSHFDPMFKKVGDTGTAQLSTMESYWNQLVRIGTGGMFEGLKHELKNINDWYTKHQEQVDQIAKTLGDKLGHALGEGFEMARSAIAFMVAHKDALMQIGEAFLALKGFSMMGGGLGGAQGVAGSSALTLGNVFGGGAFGMAMAHMTGATNIYTTSLMTAEGAMATLPGVIGVVSKALLAFSMAAQFGANKFDQWTNKKFAEEDELGSISDHILKRNTAEVFSKAKAMGAIGGNNLDFDMDKFRHGLMKMGANADLALSLSRNAGMEMAGMDRYERAKRMGMVPTIETETEEDKARAFLSMASKATAPKGDTNIYLHVEQTLHDADDPERVYISTRDAIRDAYTRPATSARGVILR